MREKRKQEIQFIIKGLKEINFIQPKLLLGLVIRSVFVAVSPFINIYMSARILNGIIEGETMSQLVYLALLTAFLNLVVTIISSLLNHGLSMAKAEFRQRYQMNKHKKMMEMSYSIIEDPNTHSLYQKVREAENMNNGGLIGLLEPVEEGVKCFFTLIFSLSLISSLFFMPTITDTPMLTFISAPWFSIVIFLFILGNIGMSMYAKGMMTKKEYGMMNEAIEFNRIYGYYIEKYLCDYHAGKDIRVYHQQSLIQSECLSLFGMVAVLVKRLIKNEVKYSIFITITTTMLTIMIYLYIGIKALFGMFSAGYIVQYIGSITQFSTGFSGVMTQLALLSANHEALTTYFTFMEMDNPMEEGSLAIEKSKDSEYVVEFRKVFFRYPNTDTDVLKDINLKFSTGNRLALVGENGSGKSTMIKLLCRLYDPTEGEILLNGKNIKEYEMKEYRRIFSVVFQDFQLFAFPLGENIAASVKVDEKVAKDCLLQAGFGDRLTTMEKGLDTPLYQDFEEDGVEISGGEAQKIALARALYREAPFIVLDEPTSALDPVAEYEIYAKFDEIVGEKTAIYISHRLSSCRFCQDILVFHQGELIQRGEHQSLLQEENGKYAELWSAQAQYYQD